MKGGGSIKPRLINLAIKWNWAVSLIASPPNHVHPVKRKLHGASADLDLWSLLLTGIESESICNPARCSVKFKICEPPYAGSCSRCRAWQSVVAVLNTPRNYNYPLPKFKIAHDTRIPRKCKRNAHTCKLPCGDRSQMCPAMFTKHLHV
jgi:hypothetical protein